MSRKKEKAVAVPRIRCAIYTRKSTEDGLEQEFNSLDAQREAGESYIASQRHEGWECLPARYDDGGFTGANMDRPALCRLLADIEAGQVDCVVVYKVDRLSRSLLDFARIMETFDRHKVAFVSVTQAFNTASSMGRLVLNVLLSFAQFEREMISERTRDKIAAARRKGKWVGGLPILGYTVENSKLVVDPHEARRVQEIFRMYLERQSTLAVAKELVDRGWRTKQWTTRKGELRGGRKFDKNALYQLLTNVAYTGKIRYKTEIHEGEHQAIIDAETFDAVQTLLHRNGRDGGRLARNKHNALLRGLLRCAACECAMGHSYSQRGARLYRYYVCQKAQKRGWQECPAPSLPAGEIEQFVVEQIKRIGRDPAVIGDTLAQARREAAQRIESLEAETASLRRQIRDEYAQLSQLAANAASGDPRLPEAHDRIREAERRFTAVEDELAKLRADLIDEDEITAALTDFDELWGTLTSSEQNRVIELLIEQVAYDGRGSKLSITYRPSGIRTLASEIAGDREAAAC